MSTNKVWFITGASRGFGLEITKAALAAGDKVVGTVRSQPEKLSAELNHPNFQAVILDVTNEAQAIEAAGKTIELFGRIDVLVNNAGFGLLSAVEEGTDKEVRHMYDTNVFGLLHVTRAFLPYMRQQKAGHIINITSVGGLASAAGWGLYASTKFAVEGINEALADELRPLGIFATAVEPGYFRTNFLDGTSLTSAAKVITDYSETSGKMRDIVPQVSYNQPGDPVKLAQAIIKLAAAKNPPVHLPLGKDTLFYFNQKMEKFNAEIEEWHEVITSTDHDDVK
ncbi:NADP-dependent 3-hydroxy acid dehydrogenase YdfG [Chitinophaga sp. YR627]|uniref:oxidoreductase n=1 Tax=Chitinophaga sp. YR627 TaxID=1881041 RepID=UPI0008E6F8BB|nr:oxidoreductase [Chitinophaga sp. YR627]SFM98794.1 NADP-dependent 3-hydroxy acid dehydrogenase YdfG [Chitinophaga sp. YR627]